MSGLPAGEPRNRRFPIFTVPELLRQQAKPRAVSAATIAFVSADSWFGLRRGFGRRRRGGLSKLQNRLLGRYGGDLRGW